MKIISWLAGLSAKTKRVSTIIAGTVFVGLGVGVGMTLNNYDNSTSDSSTCIEESIGSSMAENSILDSSIETSSSVESSSLESSVDSSDESSMESSVDSSDESSTESSVDSSDDSSVDSAEDSSEESSTESAEDSSSESGTDSTETSSSESGTDSSEEVGGESSTDSVEPAPHEHDFSLEVIENRYLKTEASCEGKAVYYYACVCGEHAEATFEYGSALEHDKVQHDAQAATCTEKGWNAYETCSRCNYTTYAEIQALTHDEIIDPSVSATCNSTGLTEGTHCSRCNETIVAQQVIDKLAHTPTTDAAVEATCSATGLTEGSHCSVCKEVLVAQEEVAMKAHTISEWITEREATCSVKGIKYKQCTVCHDVLQTAMVDKLAHTPTTDAAVEATCSTTGRTEGSHCSVCNAVIVAQEVVAKKPHTASEWMIDTQATCVVDGKKHKVCTVCNTTIDEETWKGNHDYETTVVPPTVIDYGYTRYVCTICHKQYDDDLISPLGFTSFAYRVNEDEESCTITGLGVVTETEIEIPLEMDGYAVTAIGDKAFEDCTELTEILLHDAITTIGAQAFYGCTGLTEFTIPKNVCHFGTKIFEKAINLTTIYYNSSYGPGENNPILATSSIEKVVFGGTALPQSACYNIANLKEIIILGSITTIPKSAFQGCSGLTKVVVGDQVSTIGDYAFCGCSELEEITLGKSVGQLGVKDGNTFTQCLKLEKVYFTGTIEDWCKISYAENASGCMPCQYGADLYVNGDLLTDVVIPNTITVIQDYAFYNCQNVESIILPNGVTQIGDFAFYNCKLVTSLSIPHSVTNIGEAAFFGCDNLVQVLIPESVSSVGSSVFGYNLFGVIYCEAESRPEGWSNDWCYSSTPVIWDCSNNDIAGDAYIYVIMDGILYGIKDDETTLLKASKDITTASVPETIRHRTVDYEVTSICEKAFYDCSNLTSVTLPDTVITIGEYAFEGCGGLVEMTLPFVGATRGGTNSTYFGYIFGASSYSDNGNYVPASLRKVTITGGTIASFAFFGCSGLTSIELPDDITSIGSSAFENCSGLTSIAISNSVTSIGEKAFLGCSSLTSIEIPDRVTSIGEYTFYNCSSLTSVVIPDSVALIESYAFSGCSSLTEVTIGEGVTAIGRSAFSGCANLTSIIFEDTSGWYRTSSAGNWNGKTGGISVNVTDPSANVTEFMTAKKRYWYKI